MNKKVLIIGGGNIGTDFACEFAAKGYEVNVYTSQPEKYKGKLQIVDGQGRVVTQGTIALATHDLQKAMEGCSVIFVIVPAFLLEQTAQNMLPFVLPGTCIGVIPGSGGAEFAFAECIRKGAVLFGLQRVPGIARLVEYGKSVCVEGRKKELFLGSIPKEKGPELCRLMEEVFEIPCTQVPNYLNITLTPSNPILHTTRLCTMFRDYREGKVYDRNPLFYGEWSMESSELLLACDEELQDMIRALKPLDLSMVKSLKDHYESRNAQQLTDKISSIPSLHPLTSPMKEVEGGWVPDFDSRYFTADFPYGLSILIELAGVLGVPVPHMEETMDWYRSVTGRKDSYDLSKAGIHTAEDVYRYYS